VNLYKITDEYVKAFEELNSIEGVDQETINNTLEAFNSEITDKVINIASYIKNLEAESNAMDDYIKSMTEKKNSRKKKIEWLKSYLRENLIRVGKDKVNGDELSIILGGEDISTDVFDINIVPINFCVKIEEIRPDKERIKEALLNGQDVDGARLVKTRRLTIK
jgi:SMC interacting uncharacterized protein involved in chromosome segregation